MLCDVIGKPFTVIGFGLKSRVAVRHDLYLQEV